MSSLIVYTMENCPNCERLKTTLKNSNLDYEEKNLETKDSIIDLLLCLFLSGSSGPLVRKSVL